MGQLLLITLAFLQDSRQEGLCDQASIGIKVSESKPYTIVSVSKEYWVTRGFCEGLLSNLLRPITVENFQSINGVGVTKELGNESETIVHIKRLDDRGIVVIRDG